MANFDLLREIAIETPSKIVMCVLDGLGGLPLEPGGLTELETAKTPTFDRLAQVGMVGAHNPVDWGVTPGSGPAHLGIFGYEPTKYLIGRGALESIGIGFDLGPNDLAARGNMCTIDDAGVITDRRAGRIPTAVTEAAVETMRAIRIPGVEIFVQAVQDYRFVVIFRADDLHDALSETDPGREGLPPRPVVAHDPAAQRAAAIVNDFVAQAKDKLAPHHPANMIVLRGFAKRPHLPSFREVYKLRAAAIAVYPMYKGLANLVGMTIVPTGTTPADQFQTLREQWDNYDFFFLHFKKTDSAGEDGAFDRKVKAIEEVDEAAAALFDLKPDVVIVTGDHSTPASLRSHSWHPVPTLFHSKWARFDGVGEFNESACRRGGLGVVPAKELLPLALAHALKLQKYGA